MGRNVLRNIVVVSLQAIFVRFPLVKLIKICFSVALNVRETEKIIGFPQISPGAYRIACIMAMAANTPPPPSGNARALPTVSDGGGVFPV